MRTSSFRNTHLFVHVPERRDKQESAYESTKQKRLLKQFGPFPEGGYTYQDLERFLDLLYGMYSYVYNLEELRQIIVSNPFDHSTPPRSMKLVEFVEWLEAILAEQQC